MRLFKRLKDEDYELEIPPDEIDREKEMLSEVYHDVDALLIPGSRFQTQTTLYRVEG